MVNSRLLWFASIAFLFATVGTPSATMGSQGSPVAVVTKLEDTDDGRCDVDDCSLREAVTSLTDGGTITFADGANGVLNLSDTIHIANSIEIKGMLPTSDVVTIRAENSHLIFRVEPKATLTLDLLTLMGNNEVEVSGGIYIDNGKLIVIDSTFHDNANSAIVNFQGSVEIVGSTFYKNVAVEGGAISNVFGTVDVKNSTFFENKGNSGGAISNYGVVNVEYSTFANNIGTQPDNIDNRGRLTISNSILLGRPQIGGRFISCDGGALLDNGHNIQFPDDHCGTTIPVRDPLLSLVLADNGGPTQTIALLEGSPALNTGSCTEHIDGIDQRGMPRSDGKCDIGAYEKQ